jgi:hypothetical protein
MANSLGSCPKNIGSNPIYANNKLNKNKYYFYLLNI